MTDPALARELCSLRSQAKPDEARKVSLGSTAGSPKGSNTADLKETKALLEELT
jgi:hypothetical protein